MSDLKKLADDLASIDPIDRGVYSDEYATHVAALAKAVALLRAADGADVGELMDLHSAAADSYGSCMERGGDYWRQDRAALEAAIRLLVARVPQWRPIEEAPKDAKLLILGAGNGVWVGKYAPVYGSGYRPENPWSSMLLNHDHMAERYTRPTHFQPLPPAPKEA